MNVIVPIPSHDFDPTEVAVSWKVLCDAGHQVYFATPDGAPGRADPLMLSGEGLDVWGFIPLLRKLRLIGLMLRAQRPARTAYAELLRDARFQQPLPYAQLRVEDFDALLLPGGHAPRMKAYLESALLQRFVADFFDTPLSNGQHKPVAAVCHGVVLAARAISPRSGRSVLFGKKTTALTWKLERSAWLLTACWARFWDPLYYRTYSEGRDEPAGYRSVEMEVKRALASPADFLDMPRGAPGFLLKTAGIVRDSLNNAKPAWVVRDGNYVSARWPGDVFTFAQTFVQVLAEQPQA
jgi:putative intracellular protease/amidase